MSAFKEAVEEDQRDDELLSVTVASTIRELQVTRADRDRIQRETVGQWKNPQWKTEREKRVTASFAGKIFKLRDSINNTSTIRTILYPRDLSDNDDVKRGIRLEPTAKRIYEKKMKVSVQDCGLFVSLENGILAASPDGLVGEDGIVEVKCPNVSPAELLGRSDRILLGDKEDPTTVELNQNHNYYHQVVMQLHITERSYCDFVICYLDARTRKHDIWIERIVSTEKTLSLWNEMKLKLIRFYTQDLAPEILSRRHRKGLPLSQPPYRQQANINSQQIKRVKRQAQDQGRAKKQPFKKQRGIKRTKLN